MVAPEDIDVAGHVHVNAGRSWSGGVATAIATALAAAAGVLITRGVLGIPVLAPKTANNFGNSSTAVYAALAAGGALLVTALLHLLLLALRAPSRLRLDHRPGRRDRGRRAVHPARPLASKIFTAIINIIVGVAVISLLESDAAPSGLWTCQAPAGRSALAGTPASDDVPMAHRSTSRPGDRGHVRP